MANEMEISTGTEIAVIDSSIEKMVASLNRYAKAAEGAVAPNTGRALRADTAIFTGWCSEQGLQSLPASPDTVAAFIDAMGQAKKPATIRRYVSSISSYHKAAGVPTPTTDLVVGLAMKRLARSVGTRQQQAAPLTREIINRMAVKAGDRLIDLRDVAVVSLAYDTLARRSELVALDVADINEAGDGTGTILIRRSKTDQDGQGMIRFVAADTMTALRRWMDAAGIAEGALFRSVSKVEQIGDRLPAPEVARIIKKLATRLHIDTSTLSGHSTRVGAAQDMIAAGLDVGEVMQAGGWRSPVMVARYSERLVARRGAAAKLATLQGRA